MVGTGANRMPLKKIHPILLGKQKAEGTSLLAQHRQQFEERRQDNQSEKSPMPPGGGGRPPQRMQPQSQSQQPTGPYQGYSQPPQMSYPPSNMYPPPMSYPMPGQPGQVPPYGQMPPMQPQYNQALPPAMGQGPPHMQGMPPPSYGNVPYPPTQNPPPPQDKIPPQPPLPGFSPQAQPPPPPSSNSPSKPPPPSDSREMSSKQGKDDSTPAKKKRKSRWGAVEDKANVTGPVTTLPANLTDDQRKQYLVQFKIEEITQKLRTGELGIPADPGERSPSPEPIYNSEGKRLNTREFRVRKQLEEERHNLIKQAIDEIPNYKPPIDYKPPASKISDKVFIPAERNPAVNFIGLLIGPRGNTLKRLEKETGCKIIIRGKGSVKEGKVGRVPGQLMPGEDEPLHALITGPTEEDVKKGKQVVADIVKEGIECPDAANELRRNQLRELAELNGTLVDDEVVKCKNCGLTDHRHWECTERKNITSEITCSKCAGYGHVAADCKVKIEATDGPTQTFSEKAKMDTEYLSLMAELGVDAPAPPPPKTETGDKPHHAPTSDTAPPGPSRPMGVNPPRPTQTGNRMPPPNMNNGPPNMNGPPRGRGGNAGKWGPPPSSNSAPLSLMDVSLDPSVENKFRPNMGGPGPRGDNMHRPRHPGGPRPERGGQPWRPRGPLPGQGNNAIPPWRQQGPNRGPPPNNSFRPSGPSSGYGPPQPQSNYQSPNKVPSQGPPPMGNQSVSYPPPSQWRAPPPPQQNNFNNSQMPPPNNFGNLPPQWATQPPPPPPPE